jgi:hypothetical protein
MKKLWKIWALSAVLCLVMTISAGASGISFTGSFELDGTNFLTSTAFTGFDARVENVSGFYPTAAATSHQSVDFYAPLIFNPVTLPDEPLWEFDFGGKEYEFFADTMDINYVDGVDGNILVLGGTGNAYVDDDLFPGGKWSLTANMGDGTASFSATSTAVPIPAAFLLFGSGLMGLVGVRRKLGV